MIGNFEYGINRHYNQPDEYVGGRKRHDQIARRILQIAFGHNGRYY